MRQMILQTSQPVTGHAFRFAFEKDVLHPAADGFIKVFDSPDLQMAIVEKFNNLEKY